MLFPESRVGGFRGFAVFRGEVRIADHDGLSPARVYRHPRTVSRTNANWSDLRGIVVSVLVYGGDLQVRGIPIFRGRHLLPAPVRGPIGTVLKTSCLLPLYHECPIVFLTGLFSSVLWLSTGVNNNNNDDDDDDDLEGMSNLYLEGFRLYLRPRLP